MSHRALCVIRAGTSRHGARRRGSLLPHRQRDRGHHRRRDPQKRWHGGPAADGLVHELRQGGKEYASHEAVNHDVEYVRGDAHTNTAENFFSILKRGINGIYHHVSEAHLGRYLAEFDRYNNRALTDAERTRKALGMVSGKRLRYVQ